MSWHARGRLLTTALSRCWTWRKQWRARWVGMRRAADNRPRSQVARWPTTSSIHRVNGLTSRHVSQRSHRIGAHALSRIGGGRSRNAGDALTSANEPSLSRFEAGKAFKRGVGWTVRAISRAVRSIVLPVPAGGPLKGSGAVVKGAAGSRMRASGRRVQPGRVGDC